LDVDGEKRKQRALAERRILTVFLVTPCHRVRRKGHNQEREDVKT
jgi:hypothetical protein